MALYKRPDRLIRRALGTFSVVLLAALTSQMAACSTDPAPIEPESLEVIVGNLDVTETPIPTGIPSATSEVSSATILDNPIPSPASTVLPCDGAARPLRLSEGDMGRVRADNNDLPIILRDGPGERYPRLTNIPVNTRFEVIDEPVCYYGWWVPLRTQDGITGWALESTNQYGYHIEPLP